MLRVLLLVIPLTALTACHRAEPADQNAAAAPPAPAGQVLVAGQNLAAIPVNGAPMIGVPANVPVYPGATFLRGERMGDRDWLYVMRTAAPPARVIEDYAATLTAAGFTLPSRAQGPAGPTWTALRDGVAVSVAPEPAPDGGGTTIAVRITAR